MRDLTDLEWAVLAWFYIMDFRTYREEVVSDDADQMLRNLGLLLLTYKATQRLRNLGLLLLDCGSGGPPLCEIITGRITQIGIDLIEADGELQWGE